MLIRAACIDRVTLFCRKKEHYPDDAGRLLFLLVYNVRSICSIYHLPWYLRQLYLLNRTFDQPHRQLSVFDWYY